MSKSGRDEVKETWGRGELAQVCYKTTLLGLPLLQSLPVVVECDCVWESLFLVCMSWTVCVCHTVEEQRGWGDIILCTPWSLDFIKALKYKSSNITVHQRVFSPGKSIKHTQCNRVGCRQDNRKRWDQLICLHSQKYETVKRERGAKRERESCQSQAIASSRPWTGKPQTQLSQTGVEFGTVLWWYFRLIA